MFWPLFYMSTTTRSVFTTRDLFIDRWVLQRVLYDPLHRSLLSLSSTPRFYTDSATLPNHHLLWATLYFYNQFHPQQHRILFNLPFPLCQYLIEWSPPLFRFLQLSLHSISISDQSYSFFTVRYKKRRRCCFWNVVVILSVCLSEWIDLYTSFRPLLVHLSRIYDSERNPQSTDL